MSNSFRFRISILAIAVCGVIVFSVVGPWWVNNLPWNPKFNSNNGSYVPAIASQGVTAQPNVQQVGGQTEHFPRPTPEPNSCTIVRSDKTASEFITLFEKYAKVNIVIGTGSGWFWLDSATGIIKFAQNFSLFGTSWQYGEIHIEKLASLLNDLELKQAGTGITSSILGDVNQIYTNPAITAKSPNLILEKVKEQMNWDGNCR